jgi:hypothetical protein
MNAGMTCSVEKFHLVLLEKLRILWCIIVGTCIAARLPLGLELALLLAKFLTLAFKTDSLV